MKRLWLLLAALPLQVQAEVTVEDKVACLTEEWMDDMMDFVLAGDKSQFQLYVDQQRCLILQGGIRVTVTDRKIGRTQFSVQGTKLWTTSDGVR